MFVFVVTLNFATDFITGFCPFAAFGLTIDIIRQAKSHHGAFNAVYGCLNDCSDGMVFHVVIGRQGLGRNQKVQSVMRFVGIAMTDDADFG